MKKQYISPTLTMAEFKAERGFAMTFGRELILSDPGSPATEERTESNNWLKDNDESFWTNTY